MNTCFRVENVKELRSNEIVREIIDVEVEISRLRDITRNYENYIPLLRPIYNVAAWLRLYDGGYMPSIGRRRTEYHQVSSRGHLFHFLACLKSSVYHFSVPRLSKQCCKLPKHTRDGTLLTPRVE